VDALIGHAEVHLALARLQPEGDASLQHYTTSAQAYTKAFDLLRDKGPRWKFNDRCEALFNHSCALVGAGEFPPSLNCPNPKRKP